MTDKSIAINGSISGSSVQIGDNNSIHFGHSDVDNLSVLDRIDGTAALNPSIRIASHLSRSSRLGAELLRSLSRLREDLEDAVRYQPSSTSSEVAAEATISQLGALVESDDPALQTSAVVEGLLGGLEFLEKGGQLDAGSAFVTELANSLSDMGDELDAPRLGDHLAEVGVIAGVTQANESRFRWVANVLGWVPSRPEVAAGGTFVTIGVAAGTSWGMNTIDAAVFGLIVGAVATLLASGAQLES